MAGNKRYAKSESKAAFKRRKSLKGPARTRANKAAKRASRKVRSRGRSRY